MDMKLFSFRITFFLNMLQDAKSSVFGLNGLKIDDKLVGMSE